VVKIKLTAHYLGHGRLDCELYSEAGYLQWGFSSFHSSVLVHIHGDLLY